jgi:transketolase
MTIPFGPRRAIYTDISEERWLAMSESEVAAYESLDRYYRALCTMLYNYAPMSGHPGGSISSGRFVSALLFDAAAYDLTDPGRADADVLSYAAGHKALGLYAMWALRNEIARIAAPELLPPDTRKQLRLEDLLGFRRNPITRTPLFKKFEVKPLDGHPTPATPFVPLATGASGVGLASSLGYALAALDCYPTEPPRVHIVEGEGGLTPGRVAEALAFAATSGLSNAIVHVDWNQSSIDSDQVTREGTTPGDYVQWTPMELFHLHDWNVIMVPQGSDFQQIVAAQRFALATSWQQPTAIVYRTVKGWNYGIEGRASHGAGHKLCSSGFYQALQPLMESATAELPHCDAAQLCRMGAERSKLEACFWDALQLVRRELESDEATTRFFGEKLRVAQQRLNRRRHEGPHIERYVETVYAHAARRTETPAELRLTPGTSTSLRGELGRTLSFYNDIGQGALFTAAADLLGSTSVVDAARGFPSGFFHARGNSASRLLSIGGICEDAMAGVLSGIATFRRHIAVGASYAAFMAPLSHIAARLHAIGSEAARHVFGTPPGTMVVVCAHAGLKTGEDGPTHADPQSLQILQENFPQGAVITLTPWDPQEIYPLFSEALASRPAVIAPFVTRPVEPVLDRALLSLAPAAAATSGVYRLRPSASGDPDAVVVLQESGVTYEFLMEALPRLDAGGFDVEIYYVASAELFDLLTPQEQEKILPAAATQMAMGITGFTLSTMYRWIPTAAGRRATLHPFMRGGYLGSGPAADVLAEAGLDGASQYRAVRQFIETLRQQVPHDPQRAATVRVGQASG